MVYSTGGNRYLTNTAPDGSYVVSAYLNGRLASLTERNSSGGSLAFEERTKPPWAGIAAANRQA
jgi:hypothetical protein